MDDNRLPIWTIYDSPSDYPGKVVVRLFMNDTPTKTGYVADSLATARAFIPQGLVRMERHPEDDPTILETWF